MIRLVVTFIFALLLAAPICAQGVPHDEVQTVSVGSTYVPLDSWIYPALNRVAAMGFIQSDLSGMRPWTRRECARLVEEGVERYELLGDDPRQPGVVKPVLERLSLEFAPEMAGRADGVQLESVYTRVAGVAGTPLNSGYYFGQTITNELGRPHRRGLNLASGLKFHWVAGRFSAALWGEHRFSQTGDTLPLSARQEIAQVDQLPLPAGGKFPQLNQFRWLDSYVAVSTDNWMLSFGKQSLRLSLIHI